jgi:hypothetical protein
MNIVETQIEAYNNQDIETFLNCYSDEIKVFMLDSNQILTDGKAQLSTTMKQAFSTNVNSKSEILTQIQQGDLIVNHERISNHITGKMVKTISIYQVKDEKITQLWFGGRTIE